MQVCIGNAWFTGVLTESIQLIPRAYSSENCSCPLNPDCPYSTDLYATINGYLELALLEGHQRFNAISTSNLEVYKFWDWWIFTYLVLNRLNLYLVKFEARWILNERALKCLIYFVYLKVNLDPEKNKTNQLGKSSANFIFAAVNLDSIVMGIKGELMMNLDLTILLKRWTSASMTALNAYIGSHLIK